MARNLQERAIIVPCETIHKQDDSEHLYAVTLICASDSLVGKMVCQWLIGMLFALEKIEVRMTRKRCQFD